MAKKRTTKSKKDTEAKIEEAKNEEVKNEVDKPASENIEVKDPEAQLKSLMKKGGERGFLTYDELNKELPDDAASPGRLDDLLATMDEMGISLVEETDVESHPAEEIVETEEFEEVEVPLDEQAEEKEKLLKDDELLEKDLVVAEAPPHRRPHSHVFNANGSNTAAYKER